MVIKGQEYHQHWCRGTKPIDCGTGQKTAKVLPPDTCVGQGGGALWLKGWPPLGDFLLAVQVPIEVGGMYYYVLQYVRSLTQPSAGQDNTGPICCAGLRLGEGFAGVGLVDGLP